MLSLVSVVVALRSGGSRVTRSLSSVLQSTPLCVRVWSPVDNVPLLNVPSLGATKCLVFPSARCWTQLVGVDLVRPSGNLTKQLRTWPQLIPRRERLAWVPLCALRLTRNRLVPLSSDRKLLSLVLQLAPNMLLLWTIVGGPLTTVPLSSVVSLGQASAAVVNRTTRGVLSLCTVIRNLGSVLRVLCS